MLNWEGDELGKGKDVWDKVNISFVWIEEMGSANPKDESHVAIDASCEGV